MCIRDSTYGGQAQKVQARRGPTPELHCHCPQGRTVAAGKAGADTGRHRRSAGPAATARAQETVCADNDLHRLPRSRQAP